MKFALIDDNNIIQNIINYDGSSSFSPPTGLTLQQVNDWLQIGQSTDASEPLSTDPTAAGALLKTQAQAALDKSDITILRCAENGVPVPTVWATYRTTLREIVSTQVGSIPTQPSYPAGT